jgi:hypothetical protein
MSKKNKQKKCMQKNKSTVSCQAIKLEKTNLAKRVVVKTN